MTTQQDTPAEHQTEWQHQINAAAHIRFQTSGILENTQNSGDSAFCRCCMITLTSVTDKKGEAAQLGFASLSLPNSGKPFKQTDHTAVMASCLIPD